MNISKCVTAVLLLGYALGYLHSSRSRAETAAELTLQYSEDYKRRDFQSAEVAAQNALASETDQLGPSSPELIPFRRDLAMIEAANGRRTEAAEQLRGLVSEAEAGAIAPPWHRCSLTLPASCATRKEGRK
jgi:thioredoxin-like negative regulator of GroEL